MSFVADSTRWRGGSEESPRALRQFRDVGPASVLFSQPMSWASSELALLPSVAMSSLDASSHQRDRSLATSMKAIIIMMIIIMCQCSRKDIYCNEAQQELGRAQSCGTDWTSAQEVLSNSLSLYFMWPKRSSQFSDMRSVLLALTSTCSSSLCFDGPRSSFCSRLFACLNACKLVRGLSRLTACLSASPRVAANVRLCVQQTLLERVSPFGCVGVFLPGVSSEFHLASAARTSRVSRHSRPCHPYAVKAIAATSGQ